MIRDELLRKIANESIAAARAEGLTPASSGFRSFINGQWQVIANHHPQIADMKRDFFDATGVQR